MAEIITMPRLSDTMTEGTVASWLKKVGDKISEGDILAEIETDKATMEFESFHSGTLLYIGIQEGETAPVDSVLAIIGNEGEDIQSLLNGNAKAETAAPEVQENKAEETAPAAEQNASELPKGVEIITMPRLSDTMTEGTVASWLKKVGDTISEGDILAEIETDKATMEFESFYSGTLLYIGIQEGQTAPVDSVLAIIGPEGTDVAAFTSGKPAAAKPVVEQKIAPEAKTGSKEEIQEVHNSGKRIFASPLAKKIAQDKGIDLAKVKGSGENGRIVKGDVENFTPEAKAAETKPQAVEQPKAQVQSCVPAGGVYCEEV